MNRIFKYEPYEYFNTDRKKTMRCFLAVFLYYVRAPPKLANRKKSSRFWQYIMISESF